MGETAAPGWQREVGVRFVAVDAGVAVNLGSALGSKALAQLPPLLSLSFPPGKLQLWVWTSMSPSFREWDGLPRTQGLASHTVSAQEYMWRGRVPAAVALSPDLRVPTLQVSH